MTVSSETLRQVPSEFQQIEAEFRNLVGDNIVRLLHPDNLRQRGELWQMKGKTIVITGGASGIGEMTALMAAGMGMNVVILDINKDKAKLVSGTASRLYRNDKVSVKKVDVSKKHEVKSAIEAVARKFGGIDYAVSCAGIEDNSHGTLFEMNRQMADRIFGVNYKGAEYLMEFVGNYLKESLLKHRGSAYGGSAVIVTSINGPDQIHDPGTKYHVSKGALESLGLVCARNNAKWGGRVNVIRPGAIATEKMGLARAEGGADTLDQYRRIISAGRRGHPAEVAVQILNYLSPDSSYTISEIGVVDGGYTRSITPPGNGEVVLVTDDPDRIIQNPNGTSDRAYLAALRLMGLLLPLDQVIKEE
jgi:NAD(P)-dependent dehydrogenase (short-subunit alcohol dehydrogenase family)